jgi:hypothetical protein
VLVPEVLERIYSASFRTEQVSGSMKIDAFPRKKS